MGDGKQRGLLFLTEWLAISKIHMTFLKGEKRKGKDKGLPLSDFCEVISLLCTRVFFVVEEDDLGIALFEILLQFSLFFPHHLAS